MVTISNAPGLVFNLNDPRTVMVYIKNDWSAYPTSTHDKWGTWNIIQFSSTQTGGQFGGFAGFGHHRNWGTVAYLHNPSCTDAISGAGLCSWHGAGYWTSYAHYDPHPTHDNHPFADDTWVHWAMTWDGIRFRYYVDGTLVPKGQAVYGAGYQCSGSGTVGFAGCDEMRAYFQTGSWTTPVYYGYGYGTNEETKKKGLRGQATNLRVWNSVALDAATINLWRTADQPSS